MNLTQLRENTHRFMQVKRCPILFVTETNHIASKRSVGLLETKNNIEIAIVSKHYKVLQHNEVSDSVCDALQNLNLDADAKVRDGGSRLFIDFEFPNIKLLLSEVGEEFVGGVRIVNSYDKSTGVMVLPMLKRLACSNGMIMTAGYVKPFSVKHTSKLVADLQKIIPQILKDLVDNSPKLQALVTNAIGDSCEFAEIKEIAKKLIPTKKHREGVITILDTPANAQLGSVHRWQFYNAITYYCSHAEKLRPTTEMALQNIAGRLLVTTFERLKQRDNI